MNIRAKEVMVTDVVTIEGMAPLLDGLKLMQEKKVKSLVITPRSNYDAYGMLTFTDVAKEILADDINKLAMLNVYDVMSKPALTVNGDMDIKYVARLMVNFNVSRLLVTDGVKMIGLISISDIVGILTNEKIKELND